MGDHHGATAGPGADGVSRRAFLVLAGSAGAALGAVGCDGTMATDEDPAGAGATPDTGAAVLLSDQETMSLRRQRYRRHALDGLGRGFDDFDDELVARYAADILG